MGQGLRTDFKDLIGNTRSVRDTWLRDSIDSSVTVMHKNLLSTKLILKILLFAFQAQSEEIVFRSSDCWATRKALII